LNAEGTHRPRLAERDDYIVVISLREIRSRRSMVLQPAIETEDDLPEFEWNFAAPAGMRNERGSRSVRGAHRPRLAERDDYITAGLRDKGAPSPARGIGIYTSSFPGSAWERRVPQAPPAVCVFIDPIRRQSRQSLDVSAFPGGAWERANLRWNPG
jgi:hypothetical protein